MSTPCRSNLETAGEFPHVVLLPAYTAEENFIVTPVCALAALSPPADMRMHMPFSGRKALLWLCLLPGQADRGAQS